MLSQIKLEDYENILNTLRIERQDHTDGSSTFFLVTDNGAICGIYADELTVNQKLPIVAYNLYRGKIPAKLVVKRTYNNKRK
jgi:hypothetical protein